jgi:hypothetical protein
MWKWKWSGYVAHYRIYNTLVGRYFAKMDIENIFIVCLALGTMLLK